VIRSGFLSVGEPYRTASGASGRPRSRLGNALDRVSGAWRGFLELSRSREAVYSIPPLSTCRQFSQSPPSPADSEGGGRAKADPGQGASSNLWPR
jgi:hypothetical protein